MSELLHAGLKPAAYAVERSFHDRWYTDMRIVGLSRFALAISVLTFLGHVFLGFEQSWITPFLALGTTYCVDITGETLDARAEGRAPHFTGSFEKLVIFLLPAHITGLAIAMLLYAAEQLWAVVFACALAVASKYIVRLRRIPHLPNLPTYAHFLNPSNFGIAVTLLLFPAVGIAPPYQFSENISGVWDWLLPCLIILTGTYLNVKATRRHYLILAWLGAFFAQALLRSTLHGTPLVAALAPMTGFAFILFTFYMVTDPGTTPGKLKPQIWFGVSVAMVYGLLMELHIVFGLFFSLLIVSSLRAAYLIHERRQFVSQRA